MKAKTRIDAGQLAQTYNATVRVAKRTARRGAVLTISSCQTLSDISSRTSRVPLELRT